MCIRDRTRGIQFLHVPGWFRGTCCQWPATDCSKRNGQRMREYIQHGSVTTYQHCKNVALVRFWLNRRLHLHAAETSLAVCALLHDFYLYDWHTTGTFHGLRRLFETVSYTHLQGL